MGIIISYIYLFLGIYFAIFNDFIPSQYIALLVFFTIKMIFDYHKCTFSYIECKLRKVKKEEGYLYNFMKSIIDIRNDNLHSSIMYSISLILCLIYIQQKYGEIPFPIP